MKICCQEALTGRAENIVVVMDGAPKPRIQNPKPLDLQIGLWGARPALCAGTPASFHMR